MLSDVKLIVLTEVNKSLLLLVYVLECMYVHTYVCKYVYTCVYTSTCMCVGWVRSAIWCRYEVLPGVWGLGVRCHLLFGV